jgi:hypothetical protein
MRLLNFIDEHKELFKELFRTAMSSLSRPERHHRIPCIFGSETQGKSAKEQSKIAKQQAEIADTQLKTTMEQSRLRPDLDCRLIELETQDSQRRFETRIYNFGGLPLDSQPLRLRLKSALLRNADLKFMARPLILFFRNLSSRLPDFGYWNLLLRLPE